MTVNELIDSLTEWRSSQKIYFRDDSGKPYEIKEVIESTSIDDNFLDDIVILEG